MNGEKILEEVSTILMNKKIKIATAESCTGGLISHTLTNLSGSSKYFDRGIISYSNEAKIQLLDVQEDILERYGAVSHEVAKSMAEGVRKKSNVNIGLSSTGVAGPLGGTKEKPIGLVFIGISTKNETVSKKFNFKGNRIENKKYTCNAALEILLELLKNNW